MSATNDNTAGVPLDYGQQPSRWKNAWKSTWTRTRAYFHEHFEDWLKSIGYSIATLIYLAGGHKQAILALGLAFLAGGLGLAIEADRSSSGHFWMWIGGLMVGLIIPLNKSGK
jgi:hypothetical protein